MSNFQLMGTEAVNSDFLNKGSRAEFLAFLPEIRDEVRTAITNGKLKVSDNRVYTVKPVSGKTIKMFESSDPKEKGICNIQNGKLPKNRLLLVSAISLTAAITYKDGNTRADDKSLAKKATFRPIDEIFKTAGIVCTNALNEVFGIPEGQSEAETAAALGITLAQVAALAAKGTVYTEDGDSLFAAIENGDFTFKSNRAELISEMPLTIFKKQPHGHTAQGLYKLDNPRLAQDDVDLEFTIDLGEEVDADGNESCIWLRLELHGSATIPA